MGDRQSHLLQAEVSDAQNLDPSLIVIPVSLQKEHLQFQ